MGTIIASYYFESPESYRDLSIGEDSSILWKIRKPFLALSEAHSYKAKLVSIFEKIAKKIDTIPDGEERMVARMVMVSQSPDCVKKIGQRQLLNILSETGALTDTSSRHYVRQFVAHNDFADEALQKAAMQGNMDDRQRLQDSTAMRPNRSSPRIFKMPLQKRTIQ